MIAPGLTTLASKALGMMFVGTVAVAVTRVVPEPGGCSTEVRSTCCRRGLRNIEYRHVVPQHRDFEALNSGYVR